MEWHQYRLRRIGGCENIRLSRVPPHPAMTSWQYMGYMRVTVNALSTHLGPPDDIDGEWCWPVNVTGTATEGEALVRAPRKVCPNRTSVCFLYRPRYNMGMQVKYVGRGLRQSGCKVPLWEHAPWYRPRSLRPNPRRPTPEAEMWRLINWRRTVEGPHP